MVRPTIRNQRATIIVVLRAYGTAIIGTLFMEVIMRSVFRTGTAEADMGIAKMIDFNGPIVF
jgi:hypothetical protein